MQWDDLLGVLSIGAGALVIFLAIGDLMVRILLAIFGLWLIGYGQRLRGAPPLFFYLGRYRNFF